jgi:ketosteroid isomerase-like protein
VSADGADRDVRVLLVQGDDEMRLVVEAVLRSAGFRVTACEDVAAATRRVASERFALVIADFWTGDGVDATWSALDKLRAAAAPAPVGLLSGWPVDPEEAARRGFAFVVRKPITSERLLEVAGAHLVPPPDVRRMIEAYLGALERSDWRALGALCAEDVVYHVGGDHPRFSGTVHGRDAFERFAAETFRDFRDPRFELRSVTTLPRGAVARYHCRWRSTDGAEAAVDGAIVFEIADGMIRDITVRTDLEQLD